MRLAVAVFPREHTKAKGGIGQKSDIFSVANLGTSDFKKSIEQGIGILNRDHFGGRSLGGSQKPHDPPGVFIGQANMSNLPCFDVVV